MVSKISYRHFEFDDFVFEHRNTRFGAYELRNSYWKRLFIALLLMCSGFVSLVCVLHYSNPSVPFTPDIIRDVPPFNPILPQPPEIPRESSSSRPPKTPEKNTIPVITSTKTDSVSVLDTLDLPNSTEPGFSNGTGATGNGNGNNLGNGTAGVKPDSILPEDRDPEFIGGVDALYLFIGKHLRYPAKAERVGAEGEVHISFFVEPDGSISNATVIRGMVVQECNQEALRVIQKMPNWKPALYNGHAVRSKMKIPIRFKLTD